MLVKMPMTYIENFKLQLERADVKAKQRVITFTARLNKALSGQTLTLDIPELHVKQQCVTDGGGNARLTLRMPAKRLSLWSPDNPKRYQVNLSLDGKDQNGATVSDFIGDSIGFRTIETRGKQLLLNGEPIFLRGISIHEEKPNGGGRANSTEDAHTLLSWAKELGCNFVRLAHYPHNEYAVREAERMGILVWSEIPVYWTIHWENANTFASASQQLKENIDRDHNRCAIIIWSLANETPRGEARDKFLTGLLNQVRQRDDERLISMAMEVDTKDNVSVINDNMSQLVDILSFNCYLGWYGGKPADCETHEWKLPKHKPFFVSEFGAGAVAGRFGTKDEKWTEEYQAEVYRRTLAMYDRLPGFVGCSPWILMDFRSPRRHNHETQNFFNRKGIVSESGQTKQAFYVLQNYYKYKGREDKEKKRR